ncbi:MAG: tetratricopeptide repeat protein [Pseudomonadota bacterium]
MRPVLMSVAACLIALPAFGAGSQDSTPPKKTKTSTTCTDGQVWDEQKQACAAAESSSLSDDALYGAARELAYHGNPEAALKVLAAMESQDTPRVYNYRGFSLRKLGRMEEAMVQYDKAIAMDPDYILARSYRGQAYLELGDFAGAHAELLEIRNRGGRDTWSYVSLRQALRGTPTY